MSNIFIKAVSHQESDNYFLSKFVGAWTLSLLQPSNPEILLIISF